MFPENYLFFISKKVNFLKKQNSFLVLTSDRAHVLNLRDVNFLIWENLKKPISFNDLCKKIKKEYEVSDEELKKDLNEWLKQALKEKIIETKLIT